MHGLGLMFRPLLEQVVLRRRLPASLGHAFIYVTPAAGLRFIFCAAAGHVYSRVSEDITMPLTAGKKDRSSDLEH
jgi:hypothetical protein